MDEKRNDENTSRPFPLWIGILAVLAGAFLLAERMGWIPDADWWWPVFLLAAGIGIIVDRVRRR